MGHYPRSASWIMGLTGLKNNLVCFPGIIFTTDQSPSPHGAVQRLGGKQGQHRGGDGACSPHCPLGPHLPLKTILKNHPEFWPEAAQLGNWGRSGAGGFPAHSGSCSSQTGQLVAPVLKLGDRNAKGMLEFRAVMLLSLCLLC